MYVESFICVIVIIVAVVTVCASNVLSIEYRKNLLWEIEARYLWFISDDIQIFSLAFQYSMLNLMWYEDGVRQLWTNFYSKFVLRHKSQHLCYRFQFAFWPHHSKNRRKKHTEQKLHFNKCLYSCDLTQIFSGLNTEC